MRRAASGRTIAADLMADAQQLALLLKGAEAWNVWRGLHPDSKVDLREAVLIGNDLRSADLTDADLSGAHLGGAFLDRIVLAGAVLAKAKLFRAHLGAADLRDANLEAADLGGAHLCDANLEGANLRGAILRGANLFGARLYLADLQEAQLGRTIFGNMDLSGVRGLDSVKHVEPSTVGLDTYDKSKGNIPDAFLAGTGTPREVLDSIGRLLRKSGSPSR